MTEFATSAEAFRVARERASVAVTLEANMLHRAVFDAREAGLSVRETAAALNVPKSTVARHWRETHHCNPPLPVWGSPAAWREARDAVWAHSPRELADDWMPFEWQGDANYRTVKPRSRGSAFVRPDGSIAIKLDGEPADH